MLTVKSITKLLENETDKHKIFILKLTAFLHDIGKHKSKELHGEKTKKFKVGDLEFEEKVPNVKDHDIVGKDLAYDFCKKLGLNDDDCKLVKNLVDNHMKILHLDSVKSSSQIFKFVKLPYFNFLLILAQADKNASISINKFNYTIEQIINRNVKLYINGKLEEICIKNLINLELPECIINEKDLIDRRITNAELIKKKLDKALDFQINDGITDKEILLNKVKGIKLSNKK